MHYIPFSNTFPLLWIVQGHQHSKLFLSLSVYAGGHGRRKLVAIPPDEDGYTGRLIRSASGAGKTIVSQQQDLDLTPLPWDATEFACQRKHASAYSSITH